MDSEYDYEVGKAEEEAFLNKTVEALLSPRMAECEADLNAYKRMTERVERLTLEARKLRENVMKDLRKEYAEIEEDIECQEKKTEEIKRTTSEVCDELELMSYVEGMIKRLENYGKSIRLVAYHVDDVYEKVFREEEKSFSGVVQGSKTPQSSFTSKIKKVFGTHKYSSSESDFSSTRSSQSDSQVSSTKMNQERMDTLDKTDVDESIMAGQSFSNSSNMPKSTMSVDTGERWMMTSSPISKPAPEFVSPSKSQYKTSQMLWMQHYHGYDDDTFES